MQPFVPPHLSRRTGVAVCLAGLVLAACGTPSTPGAVTAGAPARDARAEGLRALGFRPTDDGWTFDLTGKLLFGTDSDRLDPENQAIAERVAKGLASLGVDRLRVEGHTDDVGTAAYNNDLSQRRAQAVAKTLAAAGLPNARIDVVGLGKSKPVDDNRSAEGRLQNRRVAVVVPAQ